ncbi:MAG: FHA domain-containing protein, partial [Solirubrobacteraceae bacterium]
MLCTTCRRQVARATVCATCGAPAPGASPPLELVLADGTCVPVIGELTIGRTRGSALWLEDPSVSRSHARISAGDDGAPLIEDAGSSYGTFVDGARVTAPVALQAGARVRVGNQRIDVQA